MSFLPPSFFGSQHTSLSATAPRPSAEPNLNRKQPMIIEIDSDSDHSPTTKKDQGTELSTVKGNLELIRTLNKPRFEELRLPKTIEKENLAHLCRSVMFIDREDEPHTSKAAG